MHKYSYVLGGTIYFIVLTAEEKTKFESRYGVCLVLAD